MTDRNKQAILLDAVCYSVKEKQILATESKQMTKTSRNEPQHDHNSSFLCCHVSLCL